MAIHISKHAFAAFVSIVGWCCFFVAAQNTTVSISTSADANSTAPAPTPSGTLRLLSQRTFFDETFSQLISGTPAAYIHSANSIPGFCSIAKLSDTKISVAIGPHAVNALGKSLTAFDLVTAWTDVVRIYPSEGRAVFRYIKGIDTFIAGREALISGFYMPGEKTVELSLSQPDTSALLRLASASFFPAILKTGAYRIATTDGITQMLLPSLDTLSTKPFLDTCYVTLGIKDNPFIGFTLNKYDFITFFLQKDIAYARSIITDNSAMRVFAEDRYFLAIPAPQVPEMRTAIAHSINKADILNNAVCADGTVLSALQSDSLQADSIPQTGVMPVIKAPLGIIFNNGDPVSVLIARKLAVDLPKSGIPCVLNECNAAQYDKKLLHNDYGIAVGWTASDITHNITAQLRLATLWFNDNSDESQRIATGVEVPLFTVKTYALYRSYIGFYNDVFAGIYIKE